MNCHVYPKSTGWTFRTDTIINGISQTVWARSTVSMLQSNDHMGLDRWFSTTKYDYSILINFYRYSIGLLKIYIFFNELLQKFHSIVLMGVAGPEYTFEYIDVGAYGSEGGASVFSQSNFGRSIIQNTID